METLADVRKDPADPASIRLESRSWDPQQGAHATFCRAVTRVLLGAVIDLLVAVEQDLGAMW